MTLTDYKEELKLLANNYNFLWKNSAIENFSPGEFLKDDNRNQPPWPNKLKEFEFFENRKKVNKIMETIKKEFPLGTTVR